MAAGVSIRISLLLQISAFSLLLLATEGNKDVHYPYTVYSAGELDSLPFHLDIRDLSQTQVRLRRQVVSTGNNSTDSSSSSPSPATVAVSSSPSSSSVTPPTPDSISTSPTSSVTASPSAPLAQSTSTTVAPPPPSTTIKSTTVRSTTPTPSPANTTVPGVNPTTAEAESTTVVEVEQQNNHSYYTSRVVLEPEAGDFWMDESSWEKGRKHGTLSNSHRTAATVDLTFKFLFYGHEVTRVTVATGGFLYMSPFLHQWLTATQYVAPLMANFDTQLGNNSYVRYMDNGTAFIVWWEDVYLQDNNKAGRFSFQALLHVDGRIVFSYKQVGLAVDEIPTAQHPVKVGLSDAYYIDQSAGGKNVQRRTIYEYHRVEINKHAIANNSVVLITPLPSCITLKSCESCLQSNIGFQCQWCPRLARCSDGLDRQRQQWLSSQCSSRNVQTAGECPGDDSPAGPAKPHKSGGKKEFPVGAVVAVILVIFVISMVVGWFVYAYKNPHTKSGQWLIEHRPSNIRNRLSQVRFWKRGDSGEKYEVSMQPDGGESIA